MYLRRSLAATSLVLMLVMACKSNEVTQNNNTFVGEDGGSMPADAASEGAPTQDAAATGPCDVAPQSVQAGKATVESNANSWLGYVVPTTDGYATILPDGFRLVLTSKANACGDAIAGVVHQSSEEMVIELRYPGTTTIMAGEYPAGAVDGGGGSGGEDIEHTTIAGGKCAESMTSSSLFTLSGNVTFTTVTATRAAGSFDITGSADAKSTSHIAGTFDLPVCTAATTPTPECCP